MPSLRRAVPTTSPSWIEVNGWKIFAHPLFIDQIENLVNDVEQLRAADPKGYREKKKAKLLAAILKMAFEVIPRDPADRIFLLGSTLGPAYRHWHRAKLFDGRYRLFFRYSTSAKAIVLAWVNDEETLRTYGRKSDAYAVFKGMLGKNRPPDDWDTLLREAQEAVAPSKKLLQRGRKAK
jgi:toxin YhaV